MITIYGIEDINDLIYVGSTKIKIEYRLTGHRNDKGRNRNCSSSKLNLDYCIIYELEKCEEKDRKEREQYWINKLDCVNEKNTIFDRKEYDRQKAKRYRKYNKEEIRKYQRDYYHKNKSK